MSVHRADGSGLRDEALQPSIRGASCIGRARARRLDGLSFFGPVQRAGPRNSASAETTCGQINPERRTVPGLTCLQPLSSRPGDCASLNKGSILGARNLPRLGSTGLSRNPAVQSARQGQRPAARR